MNSKVKFYSVQPVSFAPDQVLRVQINSLEREVQLNTSQTLLAQLEAHNIQLPTQCRNGYCGSCRVTMVSGQVEYQQEPLACLNQNEILPCCCQAKSDLVIEL